MIPNKYFKSGSLVLCVIAAALIGLTGRVAEAGTALENGQKIMIRVAGPDFELRQGLFAGLSNDTLLVRSRGNVMIDRVVTNEGVSLYFPYVGAVYDTVTQTVSGTTESGDLVVLPLDEISHAEVTWSAGGKSAQVTLDRNTMCSRLRRGVRYPELLWQIPVDSIRQVTVWRKTNTTAVAICGLSGLAVGLMHGLMTAESDEPEGIGDWVNPSRDAKIAVRAFIGLAVGTAFGYVIGQSRWEKIPLDRLKVAVGPTSSGRVGLTLAVEF